MCTSNILKTAKCTEIKDGSASTDYGIFCRDENVGKNRTCKKGVDICRKKSGLDVIWKRLIKSIKNLRDAEL